MTSQHEEQVESNEMRNMWIAVAVIVAIIVGGMGINMLIHNPSADTVQTSEPAQ